MSKKLENSKPPVASSLKKLKLPTTSNSSLFTNYLVIFLVITFIISISFENIRKNESVQKFFNLNSMSMNNKNNYCTTNSLSKNEKLSLFNNGISENVPTFAIYQHDGRGTDEGHLKHVLNILQRMGLKRVEVENEWNLLWSHDFPFSKLGNRIKNLQKHQKVNHFPGCGFITNKVDLCTTDLPFLPKAFRLPIDKKKFEEYRLKNPNVLFVEKHNEHRHIVIKPAEQINLDSNNTFIQEFIDNPYLVDGYKFDIGVYVIITNVNPLRVYIHTGDVLFRYCAQKYYPFNSTNIDQYVVGDDYLPTWEVPSLKMFHEKFRFGMKDSFDAYVKSKKQNPKIIWQQTEQIIRDTILAKESNIINILRNYKTKNFFELMRFDLIVDKELKVYLMEANMSPNLSSAHYKPNSLLYEQILYSVMQLVGVGRPLKLNYFQKQISNIESMISSEKNLATTSESCYENNCDANCSSEECQLCINCLSKNDLEVLHEAYREHVHRGDTKRIFPEPIVNLNEYDINEKLKNLSPANKLITKWFYEKCKMETICYQRDSSEGKVFLNIIYRPLIRIRM